jgi:hypothetical protein
MSDMENMNKISIKPSMTYYGTHIPSKEDWVILGIDQKRGEVCVAGWPATIAKLSDIVDLKERGERTMEEQIHVTKRFGVNFLN